MNMRKLSINKACILLGTLLLLAVGAVCAAVYLLTQNITAVRCVFLFSLFVLLCVIFFVALIRRKLVRFSDAFCGQMDDMLSENMQPKQTTCEESLFYKINYRLGRLYEVMQENKNSIAKERTDLQELISDISHQVKTPIANLKMINNTLLENEVPPQKQKEFLTAQASQLDKLGFLMQAMIKTSRLETGVISLEQRQQPVYDTLAAALGGILLNAEKKQIDVQVECPEHLDARHDRKWTSEALFNILDNAVKYTPAGGQIRVSVEGWEMYVKIDIADTGIGISREFLPHLFEPFSRERNTTAGKVLGTGLGMPIVRSLVELMGGTITVESEQGKGSKFTVTLTHKLADQAHCEKTPAGTEEQSDHCLTGKRLLLAKDNDLNAEIATAFLQDMGFTVDRAVDGADCVDRYQHEAAGTYGLILMDIQMPNMDGYQATLAIRGLPDKEKAGIPIVAMTANAFAEDRQKAFNVGMNGHIAKPINTEILRETLRELL